MTKQLSFSVFTLGFSIYVCVCVCLVTQSCPTLCDPMNCSLPGSSVHKDSPGKNTGVGCHALLQGIFPYLGVELRSSAFQADSLPSEPYVCPKEI